MIPRKRFLIFLGVMGIGLGAAFVISRGYYPIALVHGSPILRGEFVKNFILASRDYENLLKLQPAEGGNAENNLTRENIERAVLGLLIEKKLIREELRRDLGADMGPLVARKLEKFAGDAELASAAETLYGLSLADFREEVLLPQAERDVLAGRLFLKGETFDGWLASVKQSGRITIFSSRFYWEGGEVKLANGK